MGSPQVQVHKSRLRNKLRDILKTIPASARKRKSDKIIAKLIRTAAFKRAGNLMTYVAMKDEVETRGLILKALAVGKNVFVPRLQPKKGKMVAVRIERLEGKLKKGTYGILEPGMNRYRVADPGQLQLAVVPGLGFTRKGARIGRGGGYFDRFLRQARQAEKIGLAFREQIQSRVPMEPRDVRLDRVITD